MRKKTQAVYYFFFSASLFVLLLVLVLYVFPSDRIKQTKTGDIDSRQIEIEEQYKESIKHIFPELEDMNDANSLDNGKLQDIKGDLLDLKVTKEYKELHVNMIMAVDGYINFLDTGDKNQADNSRKIVMEIKRSNSWLNN